MRIDLPDGMGDIWRSGDYTGDRRPMARVTLQKARVELTDYDYANKQRAVDATLPGPAEAAVAVIEGYSQSAGTGKSDTTLASEQTLGTIHQVYASIVFGSTEIPKELPNIKSVQWSRADGQDFATCTIQFYNTKPLPIGQTPTRDLDLPGYYTFNRGQTNFANRWGQTPNEWQNLLLPDNILRTYEGYGFNPYAIPEKDEHLVQTGMWLIDKVEYTHDGLITATCRDIGRILGDQIIFPPVVPPAFYPLQFAGSGLQTGFIPPKTFTYSVTTGGKHDPNHPPDDNWIGPYAPPSNVRVRSEGDRSVVLSWQSPLPAPGEWTLRSPIGWQAASNVGNGVDPNVAFDNHDDTIWSSGVQSNVDQYFFIDFGSPLEVGGFFIDPGPGGHHAKAGVFEFSTDNVTWQRGASFGWDFGAVDGSPQVVHWGDLFEGSIRHVRVRYVRFRVTVASPYTWSLQNIGMSVLGAPAQETGGSDGDWVDGGPMGLPQLLSDVTADEDNIAALKGEIATLQAELATLTAKYNHDRAHYIAMSPTDPQLAFWSALVISDQTNVLNVQQAILPLQTKLHDLEIDLSLTLNEIVNARQQLTFAGNEILAQINANPRKGYRIAGYQIVLDNVRLPDVIPAIDGLGLSGAPYWNHEYSYEIPEYLLRNGIVYQVEVVAIWQEVLSSQGEIYFGTNVELSEVSDRSNALYVRPQDPTAPHVVPPGGTWPDSVLVQGFVAGAPGHWVDLGTAVGGELMTVTWTPGTYGQLRVLNTGTKDESWTIRNVNVWFEDYNLSAPGNKALTMTTSSGAHPEFALDGDYYGTLYVPVTYPRTLDLTTGTVFDGAALTSDETGIDMPVGGEYEITIDNDGTSTQVSLAVDCGSVADISLDVIVNGTKSGGTITVPGTGSLDIFTVETVVLTLPFGPNQVRFKLVPHPLGTTPQTYDASGVLRINGIVASLTSSNVPDVTEWDSGQPQTPAVVQTVAGPDFGQVLSGDYVQLNLGSVARPTRGISIFATQEGSIELNVDYNSNDVPGAVTFFYDDKGQPCTWKLIAYRDIDRAGRPEDQRIYSITTRPGGTAATLFTGNDLGDMQQWNYLVYGMFDGTLDVTGPVPVVRDLVWNTVPSTGPVWHPIALGVHHSPTHTGSYPIDTPDTPQVIGRGDVFFRSNGKSGEYFAAPIGGAAPHDPGPAPTAPTVQTRSSSVANTVTTSRTVTTPTSGSTTSKKTTPLVKNRTALHFEDSSNTYYVGLNGSVFGHTPAMAFDASDSTYWLSIGNMRNDQGYAFEWLQGKLDNVTLSSIEFTTAMKHYGVYVSVFAKGRWVQHSAHDVIPYNPQMPESHNGGNIPYCETLNCGDSEGPHTVAFRDPIPGATKVRITLHNLQDFGVGQFAYRAGIKDYKAYAQSGGDTEDVTTVKTGHTSSAVTDTSSYSTTSIVTTVTPAPVVAGPPQDDDDDEIAHTYSVTTPAYIQPGAGTMPGLYSDYTDIVKMFCAWGGFFWPEHATEMLSDGTQRQYSFGTGEYGLENVDPVLGAEGSGRVWGDFEQTGTAGPAPITVDNWDKKTLMDGISFIRDIIGFVFYIDEQGGVVWRQPNIFAVGNWVGNYAQDSGRTSSMVTIDERQTLIGLTATVDSANVRERIFVATVDGKLGALAKGWNPNPIGLRRVAGWTDQYFMSKAECQVMADLLALRMLFTYRTDKITIPAYPCIQVDDQVRIFEQTTSEGYIHYVSGISSSNNLETGEWTYNLDTHWLGEDPLQLWVFQPEDLASETQEYLAALSIPAGAALPEATI